MPDQTMPGRAILTIAVMAGLLLAIALVMAVARGELLAEGGRIMELAWGRVLLLDIYAGIALFAAWIAWREQDPLVTAVWIGALVLLGNLVACVYVGHAWYAARGAGRRFWHGVADQR